jgi:LEA14-like dessication related protein
MRHLFLLLACALALGSVVGCASEPSASLAGARITGLAVDHIDLAFDVKIDNPWMVPLPLAAATGSLKSATVNPDAPFLELASSQSASVPAGGSLTVPLTGRLNILPLPAALAGVRPGDEVPYTATLRLALDRPGIGRMDLPDITHDGTLPILAPPEVSVKSVSWPSLSLSRVAGSITLAVKNTNKFPLGPGTANGAITLKKQSFMRADKQLSTLSASLPSAIGAGQTKDLDVSLSFNPRDLFEAQTWAGLLGALGDAGTLKASGTLDARTPYAPVNLNFESK